jgi:hypothetical protein
MRLPLTALLIALSVPAHACSIAPGWKQPTPEQAFAAAETVVHARVLSQSGANTDDVIARVAVIRTLKGSFKHSVVRTASGSLCGINQFNVGEEYVWFFRSANYPFVDHASQLGDFTVPQVLQAIARMPR